MPIRKGTTPNPGGQFADKPFRDALRGALWRPNGKDKANQLDRLANALIDEAVKGNVRALKEIGDRMDGKTVQGIEIGGANRPPVTSLIVNFVKPGASDA
jgi:hypothetical protein